MLQHLAYLNDPLTVEFEATLVTKRAVEAGQVDVILDETYFYPTGGGQAHDSGLLGGVRVVDVFKDKAGQVVHRLAGDVSGERLAGRIDFERRLGHMQHHSAQHLLSNVVESVLELETQSAHISAVTPSTIDVPQVDVSPADWLRVERVANDLVFENRPIKSYFITDAQVGSLPFRRPPKVKGTIRVVEIEALDYSACGGTHCLHTGMIGLLKIVKTEVKNKKLRLHFVAGHQALTCFQQDHSLVTEVSRSFSTAPDEVLTLVEQQKEQLRLAQKENAELRAAMLPLEAQQLAAAAAQVGPHLLITKMFNGRSMNELAELAKLVSQDREMVAVLGSADGEKLSLVAACGQNSGQDAKALLDQHLDTIGGKGGGSAVLARGGGRISPQQLETFFTESRTYLR